MAECRLSLDEIIKLPSYSLRLRVAEGDNEDDENEDLDDENDDEEGKKSGSGGSDADDDDPRITALTAEKQRFYDQREKARKERDAARAELADIQKNGVQDAEVQRQLTELSSKLEKSDAVIAQQGLELAFYKDNTHEWVDSEAALKLADLSQVEISEEGQVEGLRVALDALAKAKPYLLKKSEEKKPEPRKTGDAPGTEKTASAAKKQQARTTSLKTKFPALRGR